MNTHEHVWATKLTLTQSERDALSRATRDSFQEHMDKLTVQPEGFVEWPEDYFDATELQDRDFVNTER